MVRIVKLTKFIESLKVKQTDFQAASIFSSILFLFHSYRKAILLNFDFKSIQKYFWLIDWQIFVSWRTDSFSTKVLDFKVIPYTVKVSFSHLNYPWLNFGNCIFPM